MKRTLIVILAAGTVAAFLCSFSGVRTAIAQSLPSSVRLSNTDGSRIATVAPPNSPATQALSVNIAGAKAGASPTTTAVFCATTATLLPAVAATSRTSLCVTNASNVTVYIGGTDVSTASGTPIPVNATWCDDVGAKVYACIVPVGTAEVRALEN